MLLERDDSLKQLLTLSDRANKGKGGIALIGGEAGIGKTSLLEAFRSQLNKQCKVLWGGSDALFTPRPLGPLYDMTPGLSQKIQTQLADGVQPSLLYRSMLEEIEQSPHGTILIFEDAHWADYATLDLLKYVGRRISILPAVLIISFRNDEVDTDHPLTAVFGELPSDHTTRIDLQALSKSAVESLGVPTGYSLNDLYGITGGNPFFVTELLECRHNPESVIPASIKDAVSSRLLRLSSAERSLLEAISVIPGSVSLNLLRNLFGENGETLAMACVGRNLLVQDGGESLRFRHELSRLATLARISSAKQKELHASVLKALLSNKREVQHNKQTFPAFDQLVHHAAGAFDSDCVLEFAPQAAKAAASVGAHREAAAHLATALRFVNSATPELAAQLYEDWAYEAGLTLRIDDEVLEARRHAITLWRALNRPEKVGENLRWLSRLHWLRTEASEAGHYADEAIRILEATPTSAEHGLAYTLRSQLHMLNDRMDEAVEWGQRALKLAEQYNNDEVKAHALNNIGTARVFRNNADGVADLEASLALSIKQGLHDDAGRVYTNLSEYAVEFKNFELAERVLAEGIRFNTEHDLFGWANYLQGRLASLRMEQGRLRDAETIASGVLKSERIALLMRLPAISVLAKTRLRLGHNDAYDQLSQALADALATDELQNIVPIRLGLIESAWLDNKPNNAREHLAQLVEIGSKSMHNWRVGETAIWAHRFRYQLPAEFLNNLPEPYQTEIEGDCALAAKQWLQLGLPYAAAMALMQTTQDQEISEAFVKAQELLIPMEANKALNKVRQLATNLGVQNQIPKVKRGPYKAAKNHPIGLTKREQQVLGLLTKGSSNKEISETLSRSQRTVEHHVSSILTKLNASSRMEAMLRVHNEPWLLPEENGTEDSMLAEVIAKRKVPAETEEA